MACPVVSRLRAAVWSRQEHKVGSFLKRRATVQTELNVRHGLLAGATIGTISDLWIRDFQGANSLGILGCYALACLATREFSETDDNPLLATLS